MPGCSICPSSCQRAAAPGSPQSTGVGAVDGQATAQPCRGPGGSESRDDARRRMNHVPFFLLGRCSWPAMRPSSLRSASPYASRPAVFGRANFVPPLSFESLLEVHALPCAVVLGHWRVDSTVHAEPRLGIPEAGVPDRLGSRIRRLLNQSTHSRVANSTASRLRHGPRVRITSVLYSPMMDSARALSYESPTLPTDCSMPASAKRSV